MRKHRPRAADRAKRERNDALPRQGLERRIQRALHDHAPQAIGENQRKADGTNEAQRSRRVFVDHRCRPGIAGRKRARERNPMLRVRQ